ncbi:hypothetical protein GCM10027515_21510 [Schumannella luteola]|uniref:Uncharacterized protein n=1 Tax=Schumannella luteola TaxID=472059 RepID=A0A852YC03_9MICO|nr:hypothetical protein [Schumannella luteola]NYH00054.1 hypothetical protein [Schumannella luteola]TPX06610.1 hypothetical protein FJ656_00215 [Schumannella luteola]
MTDGIGYGYAEQPGFRAGPPPFDPAQQAYPVHPTRQPVAGTVPLWADATAVISRYPASPTPTPAFSADRGQWWSWFRGGGRYGFEYSLAAVAPRAIDPTGSYWTYMAIAHQSPALLFAGASEARAKQERMRSEAEAQRPYFGDGPASFIGVSMAGIHLPTVPLIRWADLALVVRTNVRALRSRAKNSPLLPDPGVGGLSGDGELVLLFRNGPAVRASVDPRYDSVVLPCTTAMGQQWGAVVAQLDPALRPEQALELIFLVELLGAPQGVRFGDTGGPDDEVAAFRLLDQMRAAS